MANSVDPGSMRFASLLNSSVKLGNYLQQTTSADDIFRCIFFLGALKVKYGECVLHNHLKICHGRNILSERSPFGITNFLSTQLHK